MKDETMKCDLDNCPAMPKTLGALCCFDCEQVKICDECCDDDVKSCGHYVEVQGDER